PIRSRHPLWDDPGLVDRVPNAEEYLGTAPEGKRETIVSSVASATPEYVARLPHTSWLPILAALATGAGFVGILTSRCELSALGVAALLVLGLAWWWSGPALEKDEKDAGHGLRLPLELGDRHSPGWLGAVMMLLVDASIFASLVYSYFYLWTAADVWPPVGARPPFEGAAAAAALLLAALVPAGIAAAAGTARERGALAFCGLAAAAIALALLGWAERAVLDGLPFAVRSHAYGAVVASLIAYSLLHIA